MVGQVGRAPEGSVAADGDDGVNALLVADAERLCHARLGLELRATAGVQDGAAARHDVGDAVRVQRAQVLLADDVGIALIGGAQKTGVAAQDSHDLYPLTQCPSGDGTDGGIHTRRVAAGGQDTDFSEFLHNFNLLPPARGGLCIAFAISFFCRPTVMRASTAVPRGAPHAGQRKPKPPG